MNYSNKNTCFIMSSGANPDGFVSFFNVDMVAKITIIGRFIQFDTWTDYFHWITCDSEEDAEHNLPIILDAMSNSYEEDPKAVIKINELKGIKGTNGIIIESYNSIQPF